MGYEIKAIIGKAARHLAEEFKRSEKPYSDGSGFEPELDKEGNKIATGRTLRYFMEYASIDLCKLGYQSDSLNNLIQKSFDLAKSTPNEVHYFYLGDTEVIEDRYGSMMHPIPINELCEALDAMGEESMSYHRLQWLKALVESMQHDGEHLSVMFYGH